MRVSDIHMFVTVAEQRSISRAAEELYVAQPGISRKIAAMEKELGCSLFDRNTRGIKLTKAGEAFYRHAKKMDQEMRDARLEIRELIERPNGVLRIGYSPVDGYQPYLMNALNTATQKYPEIQFQVRRLYGDKLLEEFQLGRLDCCLIPQVCSSLQGFDYEPLYTFRRWVILPKTHPLAKEKKLKINQLIHEPHIRLSECLAHTWCHIVEDAYRRIGVEPVIAAEAHDIEELIMYVQVGRGIAFMRGEVPASYDVVSIPVDFGTPNVKQTIAWMPGRDSINLLHFVNVLKDEIYKGR